MPLESDAASSSASLAAAPVRRRNPQQRRAEILAAAVAFFAEQGFSGSTHELARRIGVTQPLLFRYFKSKETLYENVFQMVFADQWNSRWQSDLTNRAVPLRQRLVNFYHSYLPVVFNRQWMRLYVFAGLANVDLNRRYFAIIEQRILLPLCLELRDACQIGDARATADVTLAELDYVWSFHGGIFYHGMRRCAFDTSADHELGEAVLAIAITSFLDAAPQALRSFQAVPGALLAAPATAAV